MAEEQGEYPGIKSTRTLFGIIEYMAEHNDRTVTELANELNLAKSTVYDHLASLREEEFVVKEGNTYRLGLKFLKLGTEIKERHILSEIPESKLEQLADETGEAVWLIVEEHGRAVYLHKVLSETALQVEVSLGQRAHLHNLAAGKAILAHLSEDRVIEIIELHGLPGATDNTITEPDELFAELETIRERGYALNDGEQIEGVRAVGAPIVCNDSVLGAISITGAELSLRGERFHETIPQEIMGVANEIEVHLNFKWSSMGG